jgi:hypothetical protein
MMFQPPSYSALIRAMIDHQILLIAWAILAAHLAALGIAWLSKHGIRPLLLVNVAVATIMVASVAARGRYLITPPDWPLIMFVAIEAGVVALSILAWRQSDRWRAVATVIFALHLLATIAAMLFMLTFSMGRMI